MFQFILPSRPPYSPETQTEGLFEPGILQDEVKSPHLVLFPFIPFIGPCPDLITNGFDQFPYSLQKTIELPGNIFELDSKKKIDNVICIGDFPADVKMASALGAKSIILKGEKHDVFEPIIEKHNPTLFIDRLSDLLTLEKAKKLIAI